jgi:hypothetical protein
MRKVSIFIPTKNKDGQTVDKELRWSILEDVVSSFTGWFGGSSQQIIVGTYKQRGQHGKVIREGVTEVWSLATNESLLVNYEKVQTLARLVAHTLKQESVLVTVQDMLSVEFVEEGAHRVQPNNSITEGE